MIPTILDTISDPARIGTMRSSVDDPCQHHDRQTLARTPCSHPCRVVGIAAWCITSALDASIERRQDHGHAYIPSTTVIGIYSRPRARRLNDKYPRRAAVDGARIEVMSPSAARPYARDHDRRMLHSQAMTNRQTPVAFRRHQDHHAAGAIARTPPATPTFQSTAGRFRAE